ncbi:MAG: hypothetical protein EZS28_003538, partial [Streblomastix strix]
IGFMITYDVVNGDTIGQATADGNRIDPKILHRQPRE